MARGSVHFQVDGPRDWACNVMGPVRELSTDPRKVTCRACQRSAEYKRALRLGPRRAQFRSS